MRKRRVYLILLVVGVVLAGVLVAVFSREREPEYGGKRLSEWVEGTSRVPQNPLAAPPQARARVYTRAGNMFYHGVIVNHDDMEDAIWHIGTNAIPYLVKCLQYEPPGWKTRLIAGVNRTFRTSLQDQRMGRSYVAVKALIALGFKAEGAVPILARMVNDTGAPNGARRAISVLQGLQRDVLAADLVLMTNSSSAIRLESVRQVDLRGTNTRPCLLQLVQCLEDANSEVAAAAAKVLGEAVLEAGFVVPALAKSLQDDRPIVRKTAAKALGRFHLQARPSVAALQNLLTDPDLDVRDSARNALLNIDPKALETATR